MPVPVLCEQVCATDDAVLSAGWLAGAAKYFFSMPAGMRQQPGSLGYASPLLKPLVPRGAALNRVSATLRTPGGELAVLWARRGGLGPELNLTVRTPVSAPGGGELSDPAKLAFEPLQRAFANKHAFFLCATVMHLF